MENCLQKSRNEEIEGIQMFIETEDEIRFLQNDCVEIKPENKFDLYPIVVLALSLLMVIAGWLLSENVQIIQFSLLLVEIFVALFGIRASRNYVAKVISALNQTTNNKNEISEKFYNYKENSSSIIKDLKSKLSKHRQENLKLNARVQELERLKPKYEAKKKKIVEISEESLEMNFKINELLNENKNKERILKETTDKLEKKSDEYQRASTEVLNLRNKLLVLEDINSRFQKNTSILESQGKELAETKIENSKLKDTVGAYEKNNSNLSKKLSEIDSKLKESEQSKLNQEKEYKIRILKIEEELKSVKETENYQKIIDEIKEFERKADITQNLRKELEMLKDENSRLKDEQDLIHEGHNYSNKLNSENERLRKIICSSFIFK